MSFLSLVFHYLHNYIILIIIVYHDICAVNLLYLLLIDKDMVVSLYTIYNI